ncbi:MAG: hypothetical protein ABIS01_10775 [Ferruginibacter sp.]
MELNDLKNIWQREKNELESRITINEKLIKDLTFDKSKSSFDKLLKISILGRNLAFVYMLISIIIACKVFYEFEYSIPAFIGGIAMLLSFFQHKTLKRPDFSKMSTIELQKAICQFRIHTSKYSKYDISIVSLWFITLVPIYFKFILKIDISLIALYSVIITLIGLTFIFSKYIYKKWDNQLKENEGQLNKIIEFENN